MTSGAASAADAAAPVRQPLSVRLIGRGSLAGALVILAVTLVYAVALPWVSRVVTAPEPPRVIAVGDGATVTTSDPWTLTEGDGVTLLAQGGANMVILAPRPAEASPSVAIFDIAEDLEAAAEPGSVSTAPRAFETDAGDAAATVIVQEPNLTTQAWLVSNGEMEVVIGLSAPPTAWDAVSASAQQLVRSLTFPSDEPSRP